MSGDADHGVRRLVLVHGREQARRMVEPDRRALVDIAAEVLADDAGRIGITYTGFCLTGLPHRRLPENEPWQRRGHRVTWWNRIGALWWPSPPKSWPTTRAASASPTQGSACGACRTGDCRRTGRGSGAATA